MTPPPHRRSALTDAPEDTSAALRVGEARKVAARWVAERGQGLPEFAGAFLSGSAAWLPDDAELPAASDVDVMVVTSGESAPPKLGKFRFQGVLLEVSYLSWAELRSPEQALTNYHLAAGLSRGAVLADPTGRLAPLQAAVARDYATERWVRRRCADAERRIVSWIEGVDRTQPFHDQVTGWLFPTGVTTHVLLTAGLDNPTVRLRYLRVRELLDAYGQLGFHQELLALLGCAELSRERVAHHLRVMTEVFDATVPVARTPFPFSSDLTVAARVTAVDGSAELIDRGRHREAVFWIAATYARCLKVLHHDAPADLPARFAPGFAALLDDLGIASPADLPARAQATLDFLPRLRQVTERILTANPGISVVPVTPSGEGDTANRANEPG